MLRKYSGIISVLAIVVTALLAIVGIVTAVTLESFLTFLYFVIAAAVYYLFMHSYALLLEITANNEDALASIRQSLQKSDAKAPARQSPSSYVNVVASTATTSAPKSQPTTNTPDVPAPAVAVAVTGNRITCPKCGREQPANRRRCFDCGVEFIK